MSGLRLASDIAALSVALGVALWLEDRPSGLAVFGGACVCGLALAVSAGRGRYSQASFGDRLGFVGELQAAIADVSWAATVTVSALVVGASGGGALQAACAVWPLAVVLVGATRMLSRAVALRASRATNGRVLIVGAGQVGSRLDRQVRELPDLGLEPVGFLDSDPVPRSEVPSRVAPIVGPVSRLREAVSETGATHVIVAFSAGGDRTLLGVVNACRELGVEVCVVPRLFEAANARLEVRYVGGTPVLRFRDGASVGELWVKGAFDRIAAVAAIVLLGPLLLAIAAAVRMSSPGPVLFRQLRIGRDAQPFYMLKFRSMRPTSPHEETAQPDDDEEEDFCWEEPGGPGGIEGVDRRTRVGRFLRSTSLDELPQLLNIARGEMSFVGPRPERPEYVQLFADSIHRYADRHRMKPGLTGWSQVQGLRGQTSMVRRVERDNWYIENWSLALDVRILMMTAAAMRDGAA